MSDSLRIIFAGTPNFAAHYLNALIRAQYHVVGIFTQPDRLAGRGNRLISSPVKQLGEQHCIPVFQPSSLQRSEEQDWVAALKADMMIVVAYGLILPQAVLDMPRLGCINVHGSLLPRWRGAAPIQRALWAGDRQTGITIIQMDANLDCGAILHKVDCIIEPNDTSASLYDKLAKIGPDALLFTLKQLATGCAVAKPQNNAFATYADKLSKDEAEIDWRLPATQLERYIRAFNPWPISYFLRSGQPIKVWAADININTHQTASCEPGTIIAVDKSGIHIATGKGILILTQLQLPGKKAMPVRELLNSRHKWFIPGMLLN